MAEFRFTARDGQNLVQTGSITAPNANEAMRLLRERNLRVERLDLNAPPTTPVAKPASQPVRSIPQPIARKSTIDLNTPKWKPDKLSNMLFQFSEMIRTGTGVAEMLHFQAQLNEPDRAVLTQMAQEVAEGKPLSDAMMRRPLMFSEAAAGAVRVGEEIGRVPQALARASEQAMLAHSRMRMMFWVSMAIMNLVAMVVLVSVMAKGLYDGWIKLEQEGGSSGFAAIFGSMGKLLIWPWGPAWLAVIALYILFRKWLDLYQNTARRHRMAARHPYLGGFARSESLAQVTWALEELTYAGIYPARAWSLAVEACPNHHYREKLRSLGGITERTKLADIMFASGLFNQNQVSMVATSEQVGTGELMTQLRRLMDVEKNSADSRSRLWITVSVVLWFLIAGLIGMAIFMYFYTRILGAAGSTGE